MAGSYQTPGVYVEEISLFPPSVAEVDTAIPAFIGYTEKALINIVQWDYGTGPVATPAPAFKINSFLEFKNVFGGPDKPEIVGPGFIEVDPTTLNIISADIEYNHYLYDSVRLFYDNGGGPCYIVSIGDYSHLTFDPLAFKAGLDNVALVDEPTLLLFPDAVSLTSNADFASVQAYALEQCNELQDRFVVMDLQKTDVAKNGLHTPGADFRNYIGNRYLKYGAAYTPWLKVNLTETFGFSDIFGNLRHNGTNVTLASLLAPEIAPLLTSLSEAISDRDIAATTLANLATINSNYLAAVSTFNTTKAGFDLVVPTHTDAQLITAFKGLLTPIYQMAGLVDKLLNDSTDPISSTPNANLRDYIDNWIGLLPDLKRIIDVEYSMVQLTGAELGAYTAVYSDSGSYPPGSGLPTNYPADWGITPAAVTPALPDPATDAALSSFMQQIVVTNGDTQNAFDALFTFLTNILSEANQAATTFENALIQASPTGYNKLLSNLESMLGAIPPSGAVVGCYAAVDRDRGVWKAPANISIAAVNGVNQLYLAKELDALNIDVNAGKSINVIRPITGQGAAMVMGGRTLAGNDNEWRYVSVRRLFIFVEESIKKSTAWAVFEPNDRGTWVKVKGMIENFLLELWRRGALAGAKPEQAFFVKVGLPETMSAQDILEGRMIVEIGMAAVRPAEFIILKFSHKMQES